MYQMNPEIDYLYSFENEEIYREKCEYIFNKYAPKNETENTIVSHIAIATWRRKRAAETMHVVLRQLQAAHESAAPDLGQIARLGRSLVRFQKEYRAQQKVIAGCRRALWMLRVKGKLVSFENNSEEMNDVQLAA